MLRLDGPPGLSAVPLPAQLDGVTFGPRLGPVFHPNRVPGPFGPSGSAAGGGTMSGARQIPPATAPCRGADPEIADAIRNELGRQQHEIELIASENIVSRAVLEAQGSVMTNKYAEGYPGKRYYGGCQFVDVAETLAIERAKKLFGCQASPTSSRTPAAR